MKKKESLYQEASHPLIFNVSFVYLLFINWL